MDNVDLAQLLTELPEITRNSTTQTLDNSKRTRAINRVLQELQDVADFEFGRRTKTFYYIEGISEYSLENYVGCTCQDNDGATSILDFKSPYDLRPISTADKSLEYRTEAKEVREDIRRNKSLLRYAVDNGVLIVSYPRQVSRQIHDCDSLTADGAWAASVGASNLTLDEIEFKEGSGSLNFDTVAGTSLILTNSTLTAQDLEEFKNKSQFVIWVYLPTITNFTSIGLRFGSSSGNYWEKVETAPAGSESLKVGWNRFAFRWADATETGTPDETAVDYLRIALTYSSAVTDTDFRIDDIRLGKEVEMELEYHSLAMVKDSAGDYQLEFNADDVTQGDTLLGGQISRRTVVAGATYELFKIIGGKSERDRTDSYKEYQDKKKELIRRSGRPIRRGIRQLNFRR